MWYGGPACFWLSHLFHQVAIVLTLIYKDSTMPKDDFQEYLASDSNFFLHLDNPKWIKQLNKEIGETIKYHRQNRKISLAKFAQITGISVEQLKRYESGKDQLNIFHLWNLEEALDCFTCEILCDLTPHLRNYNYEDEEEDEYVYEEVEETDF